MFEGYSEKGQGSEEAGPGSFAFVPPGTPRQGQVREAAARMGYEKPQDSLGLHQYKQGPSALEAVLGLSEKIVGAKLAEMRDQRFLAGMQRAASGEALADIVNERPEWAKYFSESAIDAGARAYTLEATAAKISTDLAGMMPELAKQPPTELPKAIMRLTKAASTGDEQTDTAVQAAMLKSLPGLMKQHTKAHYAWQQSEYSKARFNAITTQAGLVQANASSGTLSAEDLAANNLQLLGTLAPVPGENEETYQRTVLSSLNAMAEAGQFHALNGLVEAGVAKGFDPDTQVKLADGLRAAQKRHAAEAQVQYLDRWTTIQLDASNARLNGDQVLAAAAAINAEYTKTSGNPEDVIPRATQASARLSAGHAMAQLKASAARQQASEYEAARKIADKQEQTRQQIDSSRKAAATMTLAESLATEGVDDKNVKEGYEQAYAAAPDKTALLWFWGSKGESAKLPRVEREFKAAEAATGQEALSPAFVEGYERYRQLKEMDRAKNMDAGANMLGLYADGTMLKRYEAFDAALAGRPLLEADKKGTRQYAVHAEQAFLAAKQATADYGKELRGDALKAFQGAVKKALPAAGNELRALVTQVAGPLASAVGVDDFAVAAAMAKARYTYGLEAYPQGKYGWLNGSNTPMARLAGDLKGSPVARSDEGWAKAIDETIDREVQRHAGVKTPSRVEIARAPDHLLVTTYVEGIPIATFPVTPADINATAVLHHKTEVDIAQGKAIKMPGMAPVYKADPEAAAAATRARYNRPLFEGTRWAN